MLMGVLPNSQFGDVAVLDLTPSGSGNANVVLGIDPHKSTLAIAAPATSNSTPVSLFARQASSSNTIPVASELHVDLSSIQSFFFSIRRRHTR